MKTKLEQATSTPTDNNGANFPCEPNRSSPDSCGSEQHKSPNTNNLETWDGLLRVPTIVNLSVWEQYVRVPSQEQMEGTIATHHLPGEFGKNHIGKNHN